MAKSGHVILVFLLYSAAMFTLPILTYYSVHRILKDDFHITGFSNRAWSLISAVIVVNLIIMSYCWRAYKDEVKDEKLLEEPSQSKGSVQTKIKKPRYVRVNTIYHTPDEIIKTFRSEGWLFIPTPNEYSEYLNLIKNLQKDAFTRDFHIKELLVFSNNVQFYENKLYQNGHILLQDKASCLPAFLLKPRPNSTVLDMCAAPGMKTTHLSALMRNTGTVYAAEKNECRYNVLCDLVKSSGCNNVIPVHCDALLLGSKTENLNLAWSDDVEYILVDPTCSGSGIVERLNIFENEKRDRQRLKKLCGFQYKLLLHALTNFPKAVRVVYSTCSTQTIENEKVVEDVLSALNDLYSEDQSNGINNLGSPFRLVEPLKETWARRGSDEFQHGKAYIFSDPKKDLTNGFFIAVFEREKKISVEGAENANLNKKFKKKIKQGDNGGI